MTQLQAIRKFTSEILGEPIVIARERDDWGMVIDERKPRIILPHDIYQNEQRDKDFRVFFIGLYNSARGFSNVTISILHELGHWFTRDDIDWEEYYNEREDASGFDYFNLKAERVATDWAITWLSKSQNRKRAKAFERELCGH